ncbi:hypothetical protein ONZ51_g12648 [Trametes cubensis]|uniref:Uncharacterized protein n=1 Tax=Trametes cubensis TaxID=1111947 RepID=A0AAD7TFN7_9APHY|nr:hypothetical protein ONZ51_g12648 [Trametes cubensis]
MQTGELGPALLISELHTYNFDAAQIGLTNLGGIVGIVAAMLVVGPLNDWAIVWISNPARVHAEHALRVARLRWIGRLERPPHALDQFSGLPNDAQLQGYERKRGVGGLEINPDPNPV